MSVIGVLLMLMSCFLLLVMTMSSVDWAAVDTIAADLVKIDEGNNLESIEGAAAWMEAQRQTRDVITAAIREDLE